MKKILMAVAMVALVGLVPALAGNTNSMVQGGTSGWPVGFDGGTSMLKAQFDLSAHGYINTGDVWQVLGVPPGARILGVQVKMVTVSTNATTYSVGDAASSNGWISAASVTNVLAVDSYPTFTTNTVTSGVANGFGKKYSAYDTLNLHFTLPPARVGVIEVQALAVKFD